MWYNKRILVAGGAGLIGSIANMVNEITGNPGGVKLVARRDWDKISRRRASIEKARKVLGYQPNTKIKDGVKKVYDWIA
jgi:nucleoside-diphosphate-sugar epimerase